MGDSTLHKLVWRVYFIGIRYKDSVARRALPRQLPGAQDLSRVYNLASPAFGEVLFHRINGSGCFRCTLTKSQYNYSQLDKEAFAIILCLKLLHQFQYHHDRLFHIITYHKPLPQLLGEHKPVPVHNAARLPRYSLILASYYYKLEF